MIKVFIIEDEIFAQLNLKKALTTNFDNIEIVGVADSISSSVEWLKENQNNVDIIFMDVELSDGKCFEIFNRIELKPKVIITTAYDNYAIKAFKVSSVDYLLKPIDTEELIAAVNKCIEQIEGSTQSENTIGDHVSKEYKKRFAIKVGIKITIVNTTDIAYFFSQNKSTYIVTFDKQHYLIDQPLDSLTGVLDPKVFYRVSRAFIVSISSIESVTKHSITNKLKLTLIPAPQEEVFVSRNRIQGFMKWLDGE